MLAGKSFRFPCLWVRSNNLNRLLAKDLFRPVYALVCNSLLSGLNSYILVAIWTSTQDMRNHGESGHHPKHDYMEMALDVKSFIERHQLRAPTIIGHSMYVLAILAQLSCPMWYSLVSNALIFRGAKTALTLALESPTLIKDVVAIDNCPIRLPLESDFVRYLEGLARLRDERITDHLQADKILTQYEKVRWCALWCYWYCSSRR